MITNGTEITLAPLELTSDTPLTGVVTEVIYPAGVEYLSHEGDGSFNGTNWQSNVTPSDSPKKTLTITIIVTDAVALSALPIEDRKVIATTILVPGETNAEDNIQIRPIKEPVCPDLFPCFDIPTYDDPCLAGTELGVGSFYKTSTGGLHVTYDCPECCAAAPPLVLTCPGLTEYLCIEDVPTALDGLDLLEVSGGCGEIIVFAVGEVGGGPCPTIIERTYMAFDLGCETFSEPCIWNIIVDDTCVEGSGCESPCPCEES